MRNACLLLVCAVLVLTLAACASNEETASRDTMTENVGVYPPPPAGITKVRVGVPQFTMTGGSGGAEMEQSAADMLTTLAFQSKRFRIIERAQLEKLLEEQSLSGIVRDGELAQSGNVRGVDLLFLGKVTNFRVKNTSADTNFGVGSVRLPFGGSVGALSVSNSEDKIAVDCGVDLRLVDPSSGELMAAHFGEFKREDKASAMGLEILGAGASADSEQQIEADNRGKLLRLALDDALRKMLPDIDSALTGYVATAE